MLKDLKNKSILVLGLGREGQTTLKFLNEHFKNKKIGTADQKDGQDYLTKLEDYEVIIKSPGIPYLPEIREAQQRGKIITSATAIFFANCKDQIIGVTGTKGKSTTAALIYEVLKMGGKKVYLIGNIGTPALDFVDRDNKDAIFVYELSSFQLEDLDVSPHIAVITNIYPEHLDHHGSFQNYKNAKANIVKFQKEDDYIIFNDDVSQLKEIVNLSIAKNKYGFATYNWDDGIIKKDDVPLIGRFNLGNIAPAIYIGRKIYHLSDKKIREAIINFKPLPHRLEFVTEKNGIRFYNDSLSTIPQATTQALQALGKDVQTLIAGGFDRGLDYYVLGEEIANSDIKTLILFPQTGEKIWQAICRAIPQKDMRPQKISVFSMEEAVRAALQKTETSKICLLSPGAASFGLFRDYQERGDLFKELVLDS